GHRASLALHARYWPAMLLQPYTEKPVERYCFSYFSLASEPPGFRCPPAITVPCEVLRRKQKSRCLAHCTQLPCMQFAGMQRQRIQGFQAGEDIAATVPCRMPRKKR